MRSYRLITVAMVPLLKASGPGAVSRFDIGLVIAIGLGTLFVVPAVSDSERQRKRVKSVG